MGVRVETTDVAGSAFGGTELLRKPARTLALPRPSRATRRRRSAQPNSQPMCRADMTNSERPNYDQFGSNRWDALQMPINGGPERARRTSWSRGSARAPIAGSALAQPAVLSAHIDATSTSPRTGLRRLRAQALRGPSLAPPTSSSDGCR